MIGGLSRNLNRVQFETCCSEGLDWGLAFPSEARSSEAMDVMLRVDWARWGQTPEDLRSLALSAPHIRTRERALALLDIAQGRCATQVVVRTERRAQTVMEWVHTYNEHGPEALVYRRTGGRPPFAPGSRPASARRCARPSAAPPLRL